MKFFNLILVGFCLATNLSAQSLPNSFKYMVIKLKVRLNNESAQAQIRLREDSIVWMSVRKAGIEGLRILAGVDSVVVLDPLHREAFIRTYDQIDSLLPGVRDIQTLQSVLLGRIPDFYSDKQLIKGNVSYIIEKKSEERIKFFSATDSVNRSYLKVNYLRYKKIKGIDVPKKIEAELSFFDGELKMMAFSSDAKKIILPTSRPDFYLKIGKKYTIK